MVPGDGTASRYVSMHQTPATPNSKALHLPALIIYHSQAIRSIGPAALHAVWEISLHGASDARRADPQCQCQLGIYIYIYTYTFRRVGFGVFREPVRSSGKALGWFESVSAVLSMQWLVVYGHSLVTLPLSVIVLT